MRNSRHKRLSRRPVRLAEPPKANSGKLALRLVITSDVLASLEFLPAMRRHWPCRCKVRWAATLPVLSLYLTSYWGCSRVKASAGGCLCNWKRCDKTPSCEPRQSHSERTLQAAKRRCASCLTAVTQRLD